MLADKGERMKHINFNPCTFLNINMALPLTMAYHYLPYESGSKKGNYSSSGFRYDGGHLITEVVFGILALSE